MNPRPLSSRLVLEEGSPSLVHCMPVVWWLYGGCMAVLKASLRAVGQAQARALRGRRGLELRLRLPGGGVISGRRASVSATEYVSGSGMKRRSCTTY